MALPAELPEPPEHAYDDDDGTCWQCGGEGVLDGYCDCMEDTCCCLEPNPPDCDICKGSGYLSPKGPQNNVPSF